MITIKAPIHYLKWDVLEWDLHKLIYLFKSSIQCTTWKDSSQHATKHFSVIVAGKKLFTTFSTSESVALSLILHVFNAYGKISSKFKSCFCVTDWVGSSAVIPLKWYIQRMLENIIPYKISLFQLIRKLTHFTNKKFTQITSRNENTPIAPKIIIVLMN